MAGKTKNYTEDFKKQIVALKQSGKSTIIKWVNNYSKSGSFKAKDNRTDEENELIRLRKENKSRIKTTRFHCFKKNNRKNHEKVQISF